MGKKAKLGKSRRDKYWALAKDVGFRSRAAFKLIQLNRKYGFLDNARVCIDLCAAPGGWMQVAVKQMPMSSIVVGVDLDPIRPVSGAQSFIGDITTQKCRAELKKHVRDWKADVVLHDGAPNVGVSWVHDAYNQNELTLSAFKLAIEFLRKGGTFVTKVFRSAQYQRLIETFGQLFRSVEATKPLASRDTSAEIFVVCRNYIAPRSPDPKLVDPEYVFAVQTEEKDVNLFKAERNKKPNRQGYADGVRTLRVAPSVLEFFLANKFHTVLATAHELVFDDASKVFLEHEATTEEIKECCKDVASLGIRDKMGLCKWRKKMLKQFDVRRMAREAGIGQETTTTTQTTERPEHAPTVEELLASDDEGSDKEGGEEGEEMESGDEEERAEKERLGLLDEQTKKLSKMEKRFKKRQQLRQRRMEQRQQEGGNANGYSVDETIGLFQIRSFQGQAGHSALAELYDKGIGEEAGELDALVKQQSDPAVNDASDSEPEAEEEEEEYDPTCLPEGEYLRRLEDEYEAQHVARKENAKRRGAQMTTDEAIDNAMKKKKERQIKEHGFEEISKFDKDGDAKAIGYVPDLTKDPLTSDPVNEQLVLKQIAQSRGILKGKTDASDESSDAESSSDDSDTDNEEDDGTGSIERRLERQRLRKEAKAKAAFSNPLLVGEEVKAVLPQRPTLSDTTRIWMRNPMLQKILKNAEKQKDEETKKRGRAAAGLDLPLECDQEDELEELDLDTPWQDDDIATHTQDQDQDQEPDDEEDVEGEEMEMAVEDSDEEEEEEAKRKKRKELNAVGDGEC
eukprot:gnl/Trimastix_PCT/1082.p1 GENE.gnl/Trimastix_PCT/1082~~gnl/Trimastix_PCT/1082.p1  ORF type:complete len:795 (-),score=303.06 gnl/Trimastix_PCT/1082:96-2480(-)